VWDEIEQTIIQKIESEWTWQGDALIKLLRAYANRLLRRPDIHGGGFYGGPVYYGGYSCWRWYGRARVWVC
jgi:hypothetical protein